VDAGTRRTSEVLDHFEDAGRSGNTLRRDADECQRTVAVPAGLSFEARKSKHARWRRAAALLLCTLAVVLWWRVSRSPRNRLYHPPDDPVAIPRDAVSIARGKHLVEAVAVCTICHGVNLGGKLAFQDAFLGRGYTSNLTGGRGGVGGTYSNADWIRSIRYGVRPDGHGIPFMPSDYFNSISDADLGAVIAYLKGLPPVDNERTRVEINLPARLLIDLGIFGDLVRAAKINFRVSRPQPPSDEGHYLVEVGGCTFCHGADLRGGQGPEPGAPGGTDLTARGPLSGWSLAEFRDTMRNGVDPQGHAINPKYMPWLAYRNMTDAELAAIWTYLRSFAVNAHNRLAPAQETARTFAGNGEPPEQLVRSPVNAHNRLAPAQETARTFAGNGEPPEQLVRSPVNAHNRLALAQETARTFAGNGEPPERLVRSSGRADTTRKHEP